MVCHSGTLADPASIHEAGARLQPRECIPEHINEKNETALTLACKNNMSEVALKLLEMNEYILGLEHNIKERALKYAIENNMLEVKKKLME